MNSNYYIKEKMSKNIAKFRLDKKDIENLNCSEEILLNPLYNQVCDSDHDDEIVREPSDDVFEPEPFEHFRISD